MKKIFVKIGITTLALILTPFANAWNNKTPAPPHHQKNTEHRGFNNYKPQHMPPPRHMTPPPRHATLHHGPAHYVYADGDYGPNFYPRTHLSHPNYAGPKIGFYSNQPDAFLKGKYLTDKRYEVDWRKNQKFKLYEPPKNHKWVKVESNYLLVNIKDNSIQKVINVD